MTTHGLVCRCGRRFGRGQFESFMHHGCPFMLYMGFHGDSMPLDRELELIERGTLFTTYNPETDSDD